MTDRYDESLRENFYLFFSVDIINSTKIKYDRDDWIVLFEDHYDSFYTALKLKCKKLNIHNKGELQLPPIKLWKNSGDEMLFYVSINESFNSRANIGDIRHRYEMALWYILAFKQTLKEYNKDEQFRVKGTAWSGNTPINNYRIFNENRNIDFLGKSIDIGFRLSKYSSRGKIIISAELAIILMRDNYQTLKRNDIELHFESRETLKGVLNDMPYPIIWINTHYLLTDLENALRGKNRQDSVKMMQYLEEFINTTDNQLHYPYIPGTPDNEPFSDKWSTYDAELADCIARHGSSKRNRENTKPV